MPLKFAALAMVPLLLSSIAAQAQQIAPGYGAPITLEDARKVIAAAEAEAKKNSFTMVITILDTGANIVAMVRMDGTQLGSIAVAEGKGRTAVQFRRPTKALQDQVAAGGEGLRYLSMPMVVVEGGELIVAGGKIIGAIGVSGGTSAQDGQVARAGAAIIK